MSTGKRKHHLDPEPSSALAPLESEYPLLSRPERQVVEIARLHVVAEKAYEAKALVAIQGQAELESFNVATFEETTQAIDVVRQRAQGTEMEDYVEEFTHRRVKKLATALERTADLAYRGIEAEVARSVYPSQERPGFWQRLLGG